MRVLYSISNNFKINIYSVYKHFSQTDFKFSCPSSMFVGAYHITKGYRNSQWGKVSATSGKQKVHALRQTFVSCTTNEWRIGIWLWDSWSISLSLSRDISLPSLVSLSLSPRVPWLLTLRVWRYSKRQKRYMGIIYSLLLALFEMRRRKDYCCLSARVEINMRGSYKLIKFIQLLYLT